ncbi:exonuclease domain-containing protein [Halalkalibacter akibai]|uniref:DNA polymerase III alpha subunit n=1 Tax=Halalkalibacter akibai (strain ATCC 43226 / DSM 21942 / CIP 109018 / JCM 9157 / 1139) TaxID=1236973 RepID=W4QPI6_HALA3|nr:exonuclease domain-containing protein [Halalkalibacter akibai]GAE33573.1 DNA polymerase III alpha subunit [Halalkalibacter akibai JCM 9157]
MINNMVQLVKQLSNRLSPNVYTSVQQQSDAARLSHLRQIQRELKQEDVLDRPLSELSFIIFDLETSGFYPDKGDQILSIGAIKMKGFDILDEEIFYSTVKCDKKPSDEILTLTGLTTAELMDAPVLVDVLSDFYKFIGHSTLVAHHAHHEKKFMSHATWQTLRTTFQHRILDTSFLTKIVTPTKNLVTLDECCAYYDIPVQMRHHALEDARVTAQLWQKNIRLAKEKGFETLRDVYAYLAKGRTAHS